MSAAKKPPLKKWRGMKPEISSAYCGGHLDWTADAYRWDENEKLHVAVVGHATEALAIAAVERLWNRTVGR